MRVFRDYQQLLKQQVCKDTPLKVGKDSLWKHYFGLKADIIMILQ